MNVHSRSTTDDAVSSGVSRPNRIRAAESDRRGVFQTSLRGFHHMEVSRYTGCDQVSQTVGLHCSALKERGLARCPQGLGVASLPIFENCIEMNLHVPNMKAVSP